MIDKAVLKDVLACYKRDFDIFEWEREHDKWEAIQVFQKHWNIEADDFPEMLERALSGKKAKFLLGAGHSFPRKVIIELARKAPEDVRDMFRNLFDETQDVFERIDGFISSADGLQKRYGDEGKQHYQRGNPISVYLWLRFPDQYYIYKYTELCDAAKVLKSDYSFKKSNYATIIGNAWKFYDEVREELRKDEELLDMLRFHLTDDCYPDPELRTLTFDVGFYISHYYAEEQHPVKEAQKWLYLDYDSGITEENWTKLLADPQVFTQKSLEIMKRMKDFGGAATCKQLSEKYGENANFYNNGANALARRIAEKTGCPIYVKEDGATRHWPILFVGRDAGKGESGVFVWKLRDELSAALDKADLSGVALYAGSGLGDTDVDTIHYWLYAPGQDAVMWPSFYQDGIMALGWYEIGDLMEYDSKSAIRDRLQEVYEESSSYTNAALALWQFIHEMKPGDVVFVKRGRTEILGKGIVESEYEYDEEAGEYPNIRRVRWTHKGSWQTDEKMAIKTLTDITNDTETVGKYLAFFADETKEDEPDPVVVYPSYTKEDFLREVYVDAKEYRTLVGLLQNKKNIILQGAPGVGKTFIAKRLAYSIMGVKDMNRVTMVQFHQSYSYEDFVMGFRPSKDGFELKKGAFYNFCKRAEIDSENDYFFIIDEINRGNLSKIFGELFMLIEDDKRGSRNKLRLLYSDELFYVPENVYIIGMMNTADRSLALLDYALRRRFAFFDLKPGFASEGFRAYQTGLGNARFDRLIQAVVKLNEKIASDDSLGEGFCIGHSYFCNLTSDDLEEGNEKLSGIVEYELIPLLKEYWFDERSRVLAESETLRSAIK